MGLRGGDEDVEVEEDEEGEGGDGEEEVLVEDAEVEGEVGIIGRRGGGEERAMRVSGSGWTVEEEEGEAGD